jgi:hypothetical protein
MVGGSELYKMFLDSYKADKASADLVYVLDNFSGLRGWDIGEVIRTAAAFKDFTVMEKCLRGWHKDELPLLAAVANDLPDGSRGKAICLRAMARINRGGHGSGYYWVLKITSVMASTQGLMVAGSLSGERPTTGNIFWVVGQDEKIGRVIGITSFSEALDDAILAGAQLARVEGRAFGNRFALVVAGLKGTDVKVGDTICSEG